MPLSIVDTISSSYENVAFLTIAGGRSKSLCILWSYLSIQLHGMKFKTQLLKTLEHNQRNYWAIINWVTMSQVRIKVVKTRVVTKITQIENRKVVIILSRVMNEDFYPIIYAKQKYSRLIFKYADLRFYSMQNWTHVQCKNKHSVF